MDPSPAGDRWAVGLAPKARNELQKFKRDRNSLDAVWEKIRELSHGKFVSENHNAVVGTTATIPIYTARLAYDLRMVYHIDIVPDKAKEFDHQGWQIPWLLGAANHLQRQVVKILRVGPRAHVDYDLWVRVSSYLFHERDNEYRKRCLFGQSTISSGSTGCLPYKFPHNPFASSSIQPEDAEDSGMDEIQIALGSGKHVAATKALYNSIIEDESANDGTEKTEASPPPRTQAFHPLGRIRLPPDPDPCQYEIINHRGASIVVGRSGTGKTTALIYKMHAIDQSATTSIRLMFVTRSRVLARHVESSFGRLNDSVNMESEGAEELGEESKDLDQALVEFDNEVDLRADLPHRFSQLNESHFPLFISFDKLCSLIEADLYEEHKVDKWGTWSVRSMRDRGVIGFKEFKEVYWPQFKSSLQCGLNPPLVYSEVVGVIKGYSEALGCTDGYLSQAQYIDGAVHKVSAHLDDATKGQIYSIFKKYEEIKSLRNEWDHADHSHYILASLKENRLQELFDKVYKTDYLYVDEVQDNLMTDIRMLRSLCSVHNTYWGGDTAQTIVAGSAFRIKDLGAYIHNEAYDDMKPGQQRFPSSLAPTKFDLMVNYRSHEGIVQCAASVVDSLYKLFPQSLDHLPRETAYDKSTEILPTIFTDATSEVSLFEAFLLNSSSSLGAQQAILVKSEETVERLSSRISEFCPILTIADRLEFDDIILYNFFTESESEEAWDFVHGFPLRTHRGRRDSAPPLSLCNELKLLYVALTRAQKRCWIWDHGYVIDAMKKFWESQGLVATASIKTNWGSNTSTSAQWKAKGQEYFAHGMYKLAAGCFKRGGEEAGSSYRIALAYYQMSRAKIEMLLGDTEESRSKLRDAATELSNCASQAQGLSARHLWFHSAICLELAHEILKSVDAFVKAELYERAIRALLDRNYFKRGLKVLFEYGHYLEPRVNEEFMERCRKYYFEKTPLDILSLAPLFDDLEDQLSYARKRAYWEQLMQLLEHYERFDELARLHLDRRAPVEALDWFLRAYNHHQMVSSLNEAVNVFIHRAEWIFNLEGKGSTQALGQLDTMLEKMAPIHMKVSPLSRKALTFFQNIRKGGFKSGMINDWSQTDHEESLRRALITHNLLLDMEWLNSRLVNDVIVRLNAWNSYNSMLSKIVHAAEPSKVVAAQRLFGFKPASSELFASPYYIVAEGSLIAESAHKYSFTSQRNAHKELIFPVRWVDKIMKDEFRSRLHDRLRKIYFGLLRSGWTSSPSFNPRAVRAGHLSRPITRAVTSDKTFKNRFNITNLAIEAAAPVCDIPFEAKISLTNPSIVQLWVRRLFDTIYPITGAFEEVPDSRPRKGQPSYPGTRAFIQQYVTETSSPFVNLSALITAGSLSMQLGPQTPNIDLRPSSCSISSDYNQPLEKSIVASFFDWKDTDGLTVAALGLRDVLKPSTSPLDAIVIVHLVEMMTCEFLYHTRASALDSQNGFPGLILPFSWARLLAKRYARSRITRDVSSLDIFLEVLTIISDELKTPGGGRWWVAGESLNRIRGVAHILQLRICWCLSLLLVNAQVDTPLGFGDRIVYSLVHVADDFYERKLEPLCRRFNAVMNQQSCLTVLCETLHHETLVRLSHKRQNLLAWQERPDILTVHFVEPHIVENSLRKCVRW